MLNKLKKILQWFVSVCFILSGLIYVGEYTVPAIVLMVLAGVIVLPPVTKKIPAFKFRKAILIITSMVLLSAGMITGENNLSPEVQAKRAAAAEAAASSKAVMEVQKAAESASHAAKETEEAASKKAQEEADAASKAAEMAASKAVAAAEAESTANKKREEANEKIKEYKELIESTLKSSSNYANTDSSNKKAFKKIAADKDSIAIFTMAWRQYLKTHMNNARVNGNLDKSQMYFFENMILCLWDNFSIDGFRRIGFLNGRIIHLKECCHFRIVQHIGCFVICHYAPFPLNIRACFSIRCFIHNKQCARFFPSFAINQIIQIVGDRCFVSKFRIDLAHIMSHPLTNRFCHTSSSLHHTVNNKNQNN